MCIHANLQNRANRYIEQLLKDGLLSDTLALGTKSPSVERERMLLDSKIDFCVDTNHHIEIKTPLSWIESGAHPQAVPQDKRKYVRTKCTLAIHVCFRAT
jgi:hypothetical protein